MRSRAFRFAMPFSGVPNPEIRSFLAADPREVHNPWPQTADLWEDPSYPWAQPLARLSYYPVATLAFKDGTALGGLSLWKLLTIIHERSHGKLDFTPAKVSARSYLALAYEEIHWLLTTTEEGWGEPIARHWASLQHYNEILVQLGDSIGLAEELLVSAVTFALVEKHYPLDKITTALLEAEEKKWQGRWEGLPDHLYRGMRRAVTLLLGLDSDQRSRTIDELAAFLEPFPERNQFSTLALEVRRRCDQVADVALKSETGEQLAGWLEREFSWREFTARMLSEVADRAESSLHQDGGPFIRSLSRLQSSDWQQTVEDEPHATLLPVRAAGRWHIGLWFQAWTIKDGLAATEAIYREILLLEGLRQQLDARCGVHCPMLMSFPRPNYHIPCVCAGNILNLPNCPSEALHHGIQRLARWGMERRFGDGLWNHLWSPCGASS